MFLDIFAHERSATRPDDADRLGVLEMLDELAIRWQAGEVSNLEAALAALDRSIDEKIRAAVADAHHAEGRKIA